MRRIQILGLIALLAIPLGEAQAMGLGNIETRSVLNQPFEARIPLVQATAEEIDSLTVRLAGNDQFIRAGIERVPALSQLRFELKQVGKGTDYIRISTHDPVAEPFLNFLVEVNWARGRLIREYTVLLDPPLYVPTQRLSISKPTTGAVAATTATAGEASGTAESWRSTEQPVYYAHGQVGGATAAAGAGGVPATGAETLWSAAAALRPDASVSMAQMMLALLKANPGAFINGNINLVKRGYISRFTIPDHQALTAVSREDALAEVKRQHALWQEYRLGGAKTTPPQTAAEEAAPTAGNTGGKKVATPEKASPEKATTVTGGETDEAKLKLLAAKEGGGEAQGNETLALTKEQLASKERENEELRSQLVESQQLVDTLKSRVALQDNQLAELQAKSSQSQAAAASPATPPAPPPAPPVAEVKLPPPSPAQPAPVPEQKPAPPAPVAEKPAPQPSAATEQKPQQKPVEATPAETKEAAVEPAQKKKKRAPPLPGEKKTQAGPSWMDDALSTLSGIWDSVRDAVSGVTSSLSGVTSSLQGVASSLSDLIPKAIVEQVPGGLAALLGGVVAVVVAVIALIRAVLRRARSAGGRPAKRAVDRMVSDADETVRAAETTDFGEDVTGRRADQTEVPTDVAPEESVDKTQIALPPGPAAAAAPAGEEDPLSEVNVYLAYERFDEAEKVVKDAIAKYPTEHKFKLRLLEVYYAATNVAAYEAAARALKNAVGESSPLWESALAMWREMSPGRGIFAAGAVEATVSTGTARQFVDITDDSAGGTGARSDTIMMAPGAAPKPAAEAEAEGLDIDLGVGGGVSVAADDSAVLDLTASSASEDMLNLTAADSTQVLDLSGSGSDSLSPDLSSTVDRTVGTATMGVSLLDDTKSGMGQSLGATAAGMDDLLDVTKTGNVAGDISAIDSEDLLSTSTSKGAPKADDHVLEFDIGGGTPAPSAEPEEIEIKAPPADDNSLEFDLGTMDTGAETSNASGDMALALDAMSDISLDGASESTPELELTDIKDISLGGTGDAAPGLEMDLGGLSLDGAKKSTTELELTDIKDISLGGAREEAGGLSLDLSDISMYAGKDDDAALSLEDLAESAGELTLDVSGASSTSTPAATPTDTGGDNLDLDLSASEMSLEEEGSSLDDLAKSMEETVAGLKQETPSAAALPDLDFSLEAPAEDKGMDFDSTQEIAHDALAKARTQADMGNEQTVVMPRSAPVDAQTTAAEIDTKLSLAKAYIELGDSAGARTILNEVVAEGNATQKAEAQRLLQTI